MHTDGHTVVLLSHTLSDRSARSHCTRALPWSPCLSAARSRFPGRCGGCCGRLQILPPLWHIFAGRCCWIFTCSYASYARSFHTAKSVDSLMPRQHDSSQHKPFPGQIRSLDKCQVKSEAWIIRCHRTWTSTWSCTHRVQCQDAAMNLHKCSGSEQRISSFLPCPQCPVGWQNHCCGHMTDRHPAEQHGALAYIWVPTRVQTLLRAATNAALSGLLQCSVLCTCRLSTHMHTTAVAVMDCFWWCGRQ